MQPQPIAIYRTLLRTIKTTFRGDAARLSHAAKDARMRFEVERHATDPAHIKKLIATAEHVSRMLKHNVVRGTLSAPDTYSTCCLT